MPIETKKEDNTEEQKKYNKTKKIVAVITFLVACSQLYVLIRDWSKEGEIAPRPTKTTKEEDACYKQIENFKQVAIKIVSKIDTLEAELNKYNLNGGTTKTIMIPIVATKNEFRDLLIPKMERLENSSLKKSKLKECVVKMEKDAQELNKQTVFIDNLIDKIAVTEKEKERYYKLLDCKTKEECGVIKEIIYIDELNGKPNSISNVTEATINTLLFVTDNKINNSTKATECSVKAINTIDKYKNSMSIANQLKEEQPDYYIFGNNFKSLKETYTIYGDLVDKKILILLEKIKNKLIKTGQEDNCIKELNIIDTSIEISDKKAKDNIVGLKNIKNVISEVSSKYKCENLSNISSDCIKANNELLKGYMSDGKKYDEESDEIDSQTIEFYNQLVKGTTK